MNPRLRLVVVLVIQIVVYAVVSLFLLWLLLVGALGLLTQGHGFAELGPPPNEKSASLDDYIRLDRDHLLVIREITATVDPLGHALDRITAVGGMSIVEGSKGDAWVDILDAETKVAFHPPGLDGQYFEYWGDCLGRACSRTYVLAACLLSPEPETRVVIDASFRMTVTGPGQSQPPADVKVERISADLDASWADLIAAKTEGRCSLPP